MHGVENQDSHAKMGVNGQSVQPLCLPAICMHLWVFCQWCMHSWSCKYLVALLALLASVTAGVALLVPLTSHRKATQCMSILEVIILSG